MWAETNKEKRRRLFSDVQIHCEYKLCQHLKLTDEMCSTSKLLCPETKLFQTSAASKAGRSMKRLWVQILSWISCNLLIEVMNAVSAGGIHNQWPASSTLLFSLPELATLRHSHACHHLGSFPDCSRCCPHYIQVPPISKQYLSHSPLIVLSFKLSTSQHHPSRAPFTPIPALPQCVTLLLAFIQPGLSSYWRLGVEPPPKLRDMSRRMTPKWGSLPSATQARDKGPTTLGGPCPPAFTCRRRGEWEPRP